MCVKQSLHNSLKITPSVLCVTHAYHLRKYLFLYTIVHNVLYVHNLQSRTTTNCYKWGPTIITELRTI